MARRRSTGEVNLGSDSFLDVIANIVGILIILIVLTGLRVSRAPVVIAEVPAETSAPVPAAVPMAHISPEEVPAPASEPVVAIAEPEEPVEPDLEPFVEQLEPQPQLVARRISLQREIIDAEARLSQLQADATTTNQRQSQDEQETQRQQQAWKRRQIELSQRQRTQSELEQLLQKQQRQLDELRQLVAEQQQQQPTAQTLEHRVTPLARIIVQDQLHFRLQGNRVSEVPLQRLVELAGTELRERSGALMRQGSRIGVVGPVQGYLLNFKLELTGPSMTELSRQGGGTVRIALTSFEIEPTKDIHAETPEEALSAGSRFWEAAQDVPQGTTFTLWTYPDSFKLFRLLQARLQEHGFLVAGRPLPEGIPISGSPEGSASAAQ